jgi:hypothetical protein
MDLVYVEAKNWTPLEARVHGAVRMNGNLETVVAFWEICPANGAQLLVKAARKLSSE